ncbi:YjbH domain-containing protein [Runella sp.]|uniref:YjbH domain-containing protein n=1 Tax=Runella sp. TaxID=1960881 RepID=UPI003D13B7CF
MKIRVSLYRISGTFYAFLLLTLVSIQDVWAQEKLRKNFENVQIDGQRVYYEQRLYRNPFIGLYEIKKSVRDSADVLTYIPLIQGIPVSKIHLGKSLEMSSLLPEEQKRYYAKLRFPLQRNNYKFDFWLQPVFTAIFGNFTKPVESNTSLLLQSQVYLWPGMVLNWGILFPIVNDLDGRPKIIRPAPLFLNQFYASGNHFVSASAGFFMNDQYGINVQYRHTDLSKPWSYGLEAGYTGFYYYPRGGIYFEDLKQLLLLADVAYRFPTHDVTLKLSGGQFLWQDKGVRFDFIRQFTNVEVGLYITKTQNGSTAGFNFAVPIPPGKIAQGQHVRLRTTDEFRWEYTYTRGYKIGERYRLGYQLDQRLRQYHRNYLNRQYLESK